MVLGLPRCCAVTGTRTRRGWAGTRSAPTPEVQGTWDCGGNCLLFAQEAARCCLSCGLSFSAVKKAVPGWFGFSQGQVNLLGKSFNFDGWQIEITGNVSKWVQLNK